MGLRPCRHGSSLVVFSGTGHVPQGVLGPVYNEQPLFPRLHDYCHFQEADPHWAFTGCRLCLQCDSDHTHASGMAAPLPDFPGEDREA